jgi:hypothetical protein
MSAWRLESRALPPDWGPMPDGVFVELHVGGAVAVVLPRQVVRDGEQIRFERSTRFIETPRRSNQREKALLGHVLGDIRPSGEPIDEAEHGFVVDIESAFGRHRHLFSTEYYRDKAAGIRVTLEKMKNLSRRRFSGSAVAREQRLGGA